MICLHRCSPACIQVYIDIEVGDEAEIQDEIATHHTALTQMETMLVEIHGSLKKVENFQTHHRLREATHRLTAEYMNERVQVCPRMWHCAHSHAFSRGECRWHVLAESGRGGGVSAGLMACRCPSYAVVSRAASHLFCLFYGHPNLQMVSAAEALLLVLVSVFQIMYLRSLFSDKPNRF